MDAQDVQLADDFPLMPDPVAAAFAVYLETTGRKAGCRSLTQTAKLTDTPLNTIRSYHRRYEWTRRTASLDRDEDQSTKRAATIAAARQRLRVVELATDLAEDLAANAHARLRAMELLAMIGGLKSPESVDHVGPEERAAIAVDRTSLLALIQQGDTATLLALTRGQSPPPHAAHPHALPSPTPATPLPPSFYSGPPGGGEPQGPGDFSEE